MPVVQTGSTAGKVTDDKFSSSLVPAKEGKQNPVSSAGGKEAYQIFSEEVLGSGPFGIVHGGVHSISSLNVVIKKIDKI